MHVGLANIDLPEARHRSARFPFAFPVSKYAIATFEFDFVFERDLGSGKKTHRDVWFSDPAETARQAIDELCCYQLVSNLRRSSGNAVQTVVTHGDDLHGSPPGRAIAQCAAWCQTAQCTSVRWTLYFANDPTSAG